MGSWRTSALHGIPAPGAIAKSTIPGGALKSRPGFRPARTAEDRRQLLAFRRKETYSGGLMKYYAMLLVAYGFFAASCERHEFEGPDGTRQIHDGHGAAAHHEADHAEAPTAE
jgi:hypothetical protein